ncbi:MAG: hypothetical protein K2I35_08260 [Duncaniella sp.]|nr:hypothetical protein [Duncaniella sp.]
MRLKLSPIPRLLLLSAVALQSCSTDEITIPKDELYVREFIKDFGIAPSDHDWNLAQHSSVTVITSTPTNIKVLADINGKRYLFADYRFVNGTQEIPVTIPKGVSNLIIQTPVRTVNAKVGSTVNLSARSRTVWEHENEEGYIDIALTEHRIFRTPAEVERYREILPEDYYNVGKVTQDFMFVSQGPFYIYPAYYKTNRYLSNIIGIYYYKEDGSLVTQDFFQLGNGNLMMYSSDESEKKGEETYGSYLLYNGEIKAPSGAQSYSAFTDEDWEYLRELIRYGKLFFVDNSFKIFSEFNHEIKDGNAIITGMYKSYQPVYGINNDESIPTNAIELSFQGIKVDIPEGQKFGMYIKLNTKEGPSDSGIDANHTYFFSESHLNTDYLWAPKPGENVSTKGDANTSNSEYLNADSSNPTKAIHAATFTREDGMIRLCFEDWYNSSYGFDSDFDLNDMVFYLAGVLGTEDNPTVDPNGEEPEPYEWIIAAEDLGGTYDWDFNDLVAGVQCVSTNYPIDSENAGQTDEDTKIEYTKVTVSPLASGGTLPIYLIYTGELYDPTNKTSTPLSNYVVNKEFHNWLGGTVSIPINVGSSVTAKGEEVTFYVPGAYTLSAHSKYSASDNKNNMGGFWVLVGSSNEPVNVPTTGGIGDLYELSTLPSGKDIHYVKHPIPDDDSALAPQMICVECTWLWPREQIDIRKAYPASSGNPGFENWVSNPSILGEWYGEGKYVTDAVVAK